MPNFDFLQKGVGKVYLPHDLYDFSREMFFMTYSINWPNFIVWFPLLLEIMVNIYIFRHDQNSHVNKVKYESKPGKNS